MSGGMARSRASEVAGGCGRRLVSRSRIDLSSCCARRQEVSELQMMVADRSCLDVGACSRVWGWIYFRRGLGMHEHPKLGLAADCTSRRLVA